VAAVAGAALAGVLLSLCAAPASAQALTEARFASVMDTVFGQGAWRMTGGYRTPEREDELRAQGAMTVRPGGTSRHSLGRPGAPGAFDLVVDGMSPDEAAQRLRRAGAPFARYQPKGQHGTQGPHLHLEPYGGDAPQRAQLVRVTSKPDETPARAQAVTIIMPGGQRGATSPVAARTDLSRLRGDALQGRVQAQIELGQAYALGYVVARDLTEAQSWLAKAVANPQADDDTRVDARLALTQVTTLLEQERADQPARYASLKAQVAGR